VEKVVDAIVTISRSSCPPPTRSRAAILNHDKILSLLLQSIKRFCLLPQGPRPFFTSAEIVISSPPPPSVVLHSTTAVSFIAASSRLVWCRTTTVSLQSGRENKEKQKIINTPLRPSTTHFL